MIKDQLTNIADTVVVGVSGGADSTALLHILYQLRHRLGVKLHVAHFNHGLRFQAGADEAFVKDLATRLNLPFSVGHRRGRLKSCLISEDQARQWRFDFFFKVARHVKAQAIALAHTENDLAETVLMRLLRGAGLLGLRGIASEHQMAQIKLIRPLLSIGRRDIERYLKTHRLTYRSDATNAQTHYFRNKIRLKLLPLLVKEYNPNLAHILVDLAHTAQIDYDYLLQQARRCFEKTVVVSKRKVTMKLKIFLRQHPSMQRMLLRLAFERLVKDINQLSFAHMQEVEDLLERRPAGSVVHWPGSVGVLKSKDALILYMTRSKPLI
ncbi:MAG: tRNA lysidine(34) synthetase TilS [Candidatus Omnitrophica bacterium]|nr:tRNA lysidine(34) synthetase TilS [Candidatus Omnitrophota bacterium]